jgi:GntR family transcriptional regulator, transcriptional repressor for pyruvate dehydrogenase complex
MDLMVRKTEAGENTRVGNLTDHVASELTKRIIGMRLRPGDRIGSEAEIATQFAVSRTVVREAVSRLKSDGLVISKQGLGAIVAKNDSSRPLRISLNNTKIADDLLHLVELRVPFEIEAASLAAARRTQSDLARMRRALLGMDEAIGAGEDGVAADVEFHRAIVAATGNPHFVSFMNFIEPLVCRAITVSRMNTALVPGGSAKVQAEHSRIYESIKNKDPKGGAAAASIHVRNTAKRLATLIPTIARKM